MADLVPSGPSAGGHDFNPGVQPGQAGDEIDDLFDYDVNMDDVFKGLDTGIETAPPKAKVTNDPGAVGGGAAGEASGFNIYDEIEVTKKKRVNVKLDDERLLSDKGIPRLRRIGKERLRFKGKGYEVSYIPTSSMPLSRGIAYSRC
jgi:replication fork protection complex subunit Csm3/Swi3